MAFPDTLAFSQCGGQVPSSSYPKGESWMEVVLPAVNSNVGGTQLLLHFTHRTQVTMAGYTHKDSQQAKPPH